MAGDKLATRNHPWPVTLISRLDVPLVAKAEDCETVPVPPAGAAPSVPVSYEASRIVAVGSGLTVTVSAAAFEVRPALSLITYDAWVLPLKPVVGVNVPMPFGCATNVPPATASVVC